MKELICNKIEILFMLLSSVLAFFVAQISFTHNKVKTVTPFYMEFRNDYSGESDPDNNLSGNSGISQDYYTKQVLQFLKSKDSSE
jgi:hypothetical protein